MHLRTLATAHTLSTCLALAAAGCSFHGHAEYRSGTGANNSAGAENEAEPAEHEHAHREHPTGRHSPAGRDNVVRVSGGSKPAVEQGGGAEESARTAVHPTGDVPASSSDGAAGSAGGGSADGGGGSGSSSGAESVGSAASESPKQADSTPAGDAPASDAPSTGKGSRKSPSEPHVATPTQQKPRKVHRTGDSATNKEGRRE